MSELERIIQLLERIENNQRETLAMFSDGSTISRFNQDDWAQPEKVLKILGISLRSLYRLRQDGSVVWVKKGGCSYYYLPDIMKVRDRFLK